MKCSNCANEMITSRTGWLCVSCGHAELSRPAEDTGAAQIVHERPRGRLEPPVPGAAPAVAAAPGAPAVATPVAAVAVAPAPAPVAAPAAAAAPTPVVAAPPAAPAPALTPAATPIVPAAPVSDVAAPAVPAVAEAPAAAAPAAPAPAPMEPAKAPVAEPSPLPEPEPVTEVEIAAPPAAPAMDEIFAAVAAQTQADATAADPAPDPATAGPLTVTPVAPVAAPSEPIVETPIPAVPDEAIIKEPAEPMAAAESTPAAEPEIVETKPDVPAAAVEPTPPEDKPTLPEVPAAVETPSPATDAPPSSDTEAAPVAEEPPHEVPESSVAKSMTDLVPHTALSSSPAVASAIQAIPEPPQPKTAPGRLAFLGVSKKKKAEELDAEPKSDPANKIDEDHKAENEAETQPDHTPDTSDSNEMKIGPDGQPIYGETAEATEATETAEAAAPAPVATPAPAEAAAPVPEPQTLEVTPSPANTKSKPPLQPQTHPKRLSKKNRLMISSVVAVFVLSAVGLAYYIGIDKVIGSNPEAVTDEGTVVSILPVTEPDPISASTPAPASAVLGAAAANTDAQRLQDLNAYAAAYRAASKNGFFPVVIPNTKLALQDPQTATPYVVSKDLPTAAGQIRYWIGGSCTGTARTPGRTGSRYLALQIYVAGQPAPACVQVNQP